MFIRKINARFFISTAAVLLLAQCALINALPTPEAANKNATTKATNTKEVTEIASTVETKKDNSHHEHDDESDEDDAGEISEEYYNDESTEVTFNEKVIQFAIKEVGAFSNKPLSSIKKFIESVTAEVAAYDGEHKEELNSESEDFTDFLSKLKKLEKDDDALSKFSLLVDIADTLDYYDDNTLDSDANEEEVLIDKFLKKNNFKSLVDELRASAEEFKKSFENKVNEFWQKLPDKERGTEKEFKKWFESFVYHKDIFDSSFLFGRRY